MSKLSIGLIALAAIATVGVGAAVADAPVVMMDPIGTLMYAVFPQTYDVTGTVSHGSGDAGLNPVNDVNLYIDGIFESTQAIPNNDGSTFNFSLPWNILAAGTYNVMVTASHGAADGSDTETVEVIFDGPVVIGQCPAAPSYAAHYLQDMGVKAGSKTFKNVISLVAQHMGPTTDFDGVAACDMPAYQDAVEAYVDANMTVTK